MRGVSKQLVQWSVELNTKMSLSTKFSKFCNNIREKIAFKNQSDIPKTITGKFDEGSCTICLDSPQVDKSFPPCGHTFCYECLVRWCKTKKECPNCLQKIQYFDHDNGKLRCFPQDKSGTKERRNNQEVPSNLHQVEDLQYYGHTIRTGISPEELETITRNINRMKKKLSVLLICRKVSIWPIKKIVDKKMIRLEGGILNTEHYLFFAWYGNKNIYKYRITGLRYKV